MFIFNPNLQRLHCKYTPTIYFLYLCALYPQPKGTRFYGDFDNAEHYTASSRCCECTKLAKVPAKQAAYWQTIKHEIKAKRKLKAVSPSQ